MPAPPSANVGEISSDAAADRGRTRRTYTTAPAATSAQRPTETGATHTDLYDKEQYVGPAVTKRRLEAIAA